MSNVVRNRINLMMLAKHIIQDEDATELSTYRTYLAEHEDFVSPGVVKGYLLPSDDNNGYYAFELLSRDGRVFYAYCVYDFGTEDISFTGWYGAISIPIDDFQNVLHPDDPYPYPDESEEE